MARTKKGQLNADVSDLNPWWRSPRWADKDPDLSAARASGLAYTPQPLGGLIAGGMYLLRGPRRVGKTVVLKQAVQHLLDAGVPPYAVVYLAVDGREATDLRTIVQNVPLPPLPAGVHRRWFIDEITGVAGDWATQLKWLRDNFEEFRNATVILTGSSAETLTASVGTLAGRFGQVVDRDRLLLPMGFRTFATCLIPELGALPRLSLADVHSTIGAAAYAEANLWIGDLVRLWELYLQFGGFPVAVAAMKQAQAVPPWFVADLFTVIFKDTFRSSQLSQQKTAALVDRVWASIATPLNQTSVAADIDVAVTTVSRHLDHLRDSYLTWRCPQLHSEWIASERGKDKIYPIDPLIGRLAYLRNSNRKDIDVTALAEAQVGLTIRRARVAAGASWEDDDGVFYVRTPSRREIDFVAEDLDGAAVEGKYTDSGSWRSEAATIAASAYRGVLTTRSELDTGGGSDKPWAVPAAVFAVLVDT